MLKHGAVTQSEVPAAETQFKSQMLKRGAVTQTEALLLKHSPRSLLLKHSPRPLVLQHRTVIQSGVTEAETQRCYKA
jgi:hypothetical protein